MKKRFLFTVLLAVMLATLQNSCSENSAGIMSTVTDDGTTVTITAINDYIVRVTNSSDSTTPTKTGGAILEQQPFNGRVTSMPGASTMTLPSGLKVTLEHSSGEVTFIAGGKTLVTDKAEREYTDSTSGVMLYSEMPFHGGGERGWSYALSDDTLKMYNTQNYGYTDSDQRIKTMGVSIPYIVSSRGYGVLFDDVAAATLTLGTDTISYTSECRQPISYYMIYSGDGTIAGTTDHYTELTGRQPMPPLWSLGYITSKYGYHDAAEATGAIDTLQSMGYPVDGIVLDLYWYGEEENMGTLRWDRKKWPSPRRFLADMKARGVNTVLITQPYVNKEGAADRYNELAEGGMFVVDSLGNTHDMHTWIAECSMIDMANPSTRQWMRNIYKELTDSGVGGWWGDLGDLETHPSTVYHRDGGGNMIPARLYHNQYGNDWSRIIADLYAGEYPETRLMSLMRGGTTGLQRFSVFPWSTDVSRSWGGMQPQIKIMLSSGLSGLGYMHHDVGGFAIDKDNPRDPELYVRWLQLGLFSPVLRTHSQTLPEPYHYPEYADIIKDIIAQRYLWLPYNYTLAYQNSTTGAPLVRPLNFTDPGNPADVDDQYMWGDEVMVAPVLVQGAQSRTIIMPPGTWVDYNNPTISYTGPDTINYKAPLDVIPLFVRSGAFIPQANYTMRNTGDYDPSRYDILFYPRGNGVSSFDLYEDDLKSASALAKGNYALIHLTSKVDNADVTVNASINGPYYGSADKNLTFRLPGIAASDITDLKVNGEPTPVTGDMEATFTTKLSPEKAATITFKHQQSN